MIKKTFLNNKSSINYTFSFLNIKERKMKNRNKNYNNSNKTKLNIFFKVRGQYLYSRAKPRGITLYII